MASWGADMLLPEHFRDRARQCLARAKRVFNPETKASLIERAKALMRFSVELEHHLATRDDMTVLMHLESLDALKSRLRRLPSGTSVRLSTGDYIKLLTESGDAWSEASKVAKDCRCTVKFEDDGTVWFAKPLPSPQSN